MERCENKKTRFIYMGDPQCSRLNGRSDDYLLWAKLLRQAEKTVRNNQVEDSQMEDNQILLLLGGDIVNHANKPYEWSAFFDKVDQFRESNFILATPVNGSIESIGMYRDRFHNTGNGPEKYKENFFSFDWGCCHFIILDSDYLGNRNEDICRLFRNWIVDDLESNTKPVVFAVAHHPFFSMKTSFEDAVRAKAMCESYLDILDEYGVDFILCGHQHVYGRGRVTDSSEIVQLMGVSGTKYFRGNDAINMDIVRNFTSVATVFETDGQMISLQTIDPDGNIIDSYEKAVRATDKNKSQGVQPGEKTYTCSQGMNYEISTSDKGLKRNYENSSKKRIVFSELDLSRLMMHEVEYSVMRRGKLCYERKRGYLLKEVFKEAGIDIENHMTLAESAVVNTTEPAIESVVGYANEYAIVLSDIKGKVRILNIKDVMEGFRFETAPEGNIIKKERVPAIIMDDKSGFGLAFGQVEHDKYNGRGWVSDIKEIEIIQV